MESASGKRERIRMTKFKSTNTNYEVIKVIKVGKFKMQNNISMKESHNWMQVLRVLCSLDVAVLQVKGRQDPTQRASNVARSKQ